MPSTSVQYRYLERDPKSSYKQLSIKGRRIRARTLFGRFMSADAPMTVQEIAADYDLPVEAVEEAIAYCQSNPQEIEEDQRVSDALMEAAGVNEPAYKNNPRPKPLTPQERVRVRREARLSQS